MVEDQLGDYPQTAVMGRLHKVPDIRERPVVGVDAGIVGNVVAVVLQGRRIEREEPNTGDSEVLQVIQLFRQPANISSAIPVAIVKCPDMQLVEDGIFVPTRILLAHHWRPHRFGTWG